MGLHIGIVGLPNVGKSTLFNALTKSKQANTANYPFCTIDPNVGVVEVPDPRLHKLVELVHPKKVIPATVEFVDIAGLIRGASKGEGLGNKFLAAIRECDAIAEVVRVFEDENIAHVHQTVEPKRDIEIIQTELILADLQTIEKRIEKEKILAAVVLEKLANTLSQGKLGRETPLSTEERHAATDLHLMTMKPFLYVANVHENEIKMCTPELLHERLGLGSEARIIPISAKIEEELGGLSDEEAKLFLAELGLQETGLNALIRAAYETLGLITFFTAGPKEVRAWTIPRGAKAPQAAGTIHTDFEKGFIAAEVIAYNDYIDCGSEHAAKEKGKMRLEGKDYVVQDGDVVHFRFNV